VLFDVPKLAGIAEAKGAMVHIDAVQAVGRIPTDVSRWPAHLVSLSAHKYHGPKGVGALFVKRRTRVTPQIVGGGQERLLRGGTENVPSIVGMGVASDIASREMERVAFYVGQLRDMFETRVTENVPLARVMGAGSERIHTTSNIAFERLEAEAILILLSEAGVCASAGSACSSGSLEPSHVLKAMRIDEALAHGAIRFSFSRFNTSVEVDEVASILPDLLGRLTSLGRGRSQSRPPRNPPLA
jgi:cysteine desulfurase